ncbi:MAG: metallophosphoesterase, partial [Peptostreptococcaceae bacterium]
MIGTVLAGSLALVGGYCIYSYNTNEIEILSYIIENDKIPPEFNDFNIVQISDLHSKSFGKNNKKLLEKIDSLNPDAIFITGDLVDGDSKNYYVALDLIDKLCEKYTVFHIIGNHEQKSLVKRNRDLYIKYFEELSKKSIINLDNDIVKIQRNNKHVNVYGLTIPLDYYTYFFKNYKEKKLELESNFIESKLGTLNHNDYNILLVHTPFFFEEYSKWGADLVLAGHVHGGIIRIPYLGGLLSPNREFFPKYDFGEYNKDKSTMLLS